MRDPPVEQGGLRIHRAGGGGLFAWPGAMARARESPLRLLSAGPFAAGVIKRLREIGPVDRAVAHWIIPSAWPLMLAGPAAPLEVRAHGADVRLLARAPRASREAVVGGLLGRGARFVFAARTLLQTLGSALPPELGRALEDASRVEPPAIDVPPAAELAPRARSLRATLALAEGERLAITACRLITTKRVDLAIQATLAVTPAARLLVIGDGPERASLERLAAQHGGSTGAPVRFAGALPRREALAWIAAADALVHPSSEEAASTVVREARALGVPVIACDAGDVAAWAKADPSIAITGATAESIADALRAVRPRDVGT